LPFVSVSAAAGGVLVKATFLKGVVLGSVVSLVMLTATAAFAGSGVGGVFNLGKYNGVNGTTALAGRTNGGQLNVTNIDNESGSTGIGITVHGGRPPLVVNSRTEVSNLNAGLLQGRHANAFLGHTKVVAKTVSLAAGGYAADGVACPAGYEAISGGAWQPNDAFGIQVYFSAATYDNAGTGPADGTNGPAKQWEVWVHNVTGVAWPVQYYAVCAQEG